MTFRFDGVVTVRNAGGGFSPCEVSSLGAPTLRMLASGSLLPGGSVSKNLVLRARCVRQQRRA